jgi:hypothetical protein
MAKTKTIDFEKLLLLHAKEEKSKFIDLLFNSQNIEGLAEDEPLYYVQKTFLEFGYMLAYKMQDKWYLLKRGGSNGDIDKFGFSKKWSIQFENGKSINNLKLNEDVYIIRYTPSMHGLEIWLDLMCKKIARIDLAIDNNLLNASLGNVYGCDDVNITSMKEALRQASQGDFAVFTNNNIASVINAKSAQAIYYGDKFYELKQKYVKEVLTRLVGVASASDKKERNTSYDMNINEATDTAYIYVDTFNNDCKKYNIPFTMKINSTIEELYNKYFEIDNNSKEGD